MRKERKVKVKVNTMMRTTFSSPRVSTLRWLPNKRHRHRHRQSHRRSHRHRQSHNPRHRHRHKRRREQALVVRLKPKLPSPNSNSNSNSVTVLRLLSSQTLQGSVRLTLRLPSVKSCSANRLMKTR